VRPQLEYVSSVWDNPVKRNIGKVEAWNSSPVVTSNVHQVSQPCCRNFSGIHFNNVELVVEYRICNGLVAILIPVRRSEGPPWWGFVITLTLTLAPSLWQTFAKTAPSYRGRIPAIPASAYFQLAADHTREIKTKYRQIQCSTNTYRHTFFPTAICLWNTLPVDIYQLLPDSFKAQKNSVQLM